MGSNSPQIENGYTKIADELFEVIIKSDLSKRELKIVFAVIRKTYGFNKTMDILSVRQIAEMTNLIPTNVAQTLTKLIKNNILKSTGTKYKRSLGLNKNYTDWLKCDQNRYNQNDHTKRSKRSHSTIKTITNSGSKRSQQKTKDIFTNTLKDKTVKIDYPSWLKIDLFEAYVKNRKFMKSPMSEHAQILAINKLSRLIHDGEDQTELIETAIENNWKSFYAKRGKSNGTKTDTRTRAQRSRDKLDELIEDDIKKHGFSRTLGRGDI